MTTRPVKSTLLLALMLAGLSGSASACRYYAETAANSPLWGLPETGSTQVLATVPKGARVCVRQELPGNDGRLWGQVGFYMEDSIRYNVVGWIRTSRFKRPDAAPSPTAGKSGEPPADGDRDADNRPAAPKSADKTAGKAAGLDLAPARPEQPAVKAPKPADDEMRRQRDEIEKLKARNRSLQSQLSALKSSYVEEDSAKASDAVAPVRGDWRLNSGRSFLRVNGMDKEKGFKLTGLSGGIEPNGRARIEIALSQIQSGDPIRDVRLAHLMFDTQKHPDGRLQARIDTSELAALKNGGDKEMDLPILLKLNEREKLLMTRVRLSKLEDGAVRVATMQPITIPAREFNLKSGMRKMMQAEGKGAAPEDLKLSLNLVLDAVRS